LKKALRVGIGFVVMLVYAKKKKMFREEIEEIEIKFFGVYKYASPVTQNFKPSTPIKIVNFDVY